MIKNKPEILQFIRDHPGASKRETAKKFGISTVTISRLRKKLSSLEGKKPIEPELLEVHKKGHIRATIEEEKPLPGNDFNPELESWTDWYRRKKRQKWLF